MKKSHRSSAVENKYRCTMSERVLAKSSRRQGRDDYNGAL